MLWTFSQDPRVFCSSLSAPQNKGTTEKRIWMLGLQAFSIQCNRGQIYSGRESLPLEEEVYIMYICNTKCNMCLNTHTLWSEGERSRSTHAGLENQNPYRPSHHGEWSWDHSAHANMTAPALHPMLCAYVLTNPGLVEPHECSLHSHQHMTVWWLLFY
jgi:hypothetical protein